MAATPADVQAKITTALKEIAGAAVMAAYVKKNGSDPAKWPTSTSMGAAAANLIAARTEAGQLLPPSTAHLTASFTETVKP